jgi:hypothetical protein
VPAAVARAADAVIDTLRRSAKILADSTSGTACSWMYLA